MITSGTGNITLTADRIYLTLIFLLLVLLALAICCCNRQPPASLWTLVETS
jgi:hypothetical protein